MHSQNLYSIPSDQNPFPRSGPSLLFPSASSCRKEQTVPPHSVSLLSFLPLPFRQTFPKSPLTSFPVSDGLTSLSMLNVIVAVCEPVKLCPSNCSAAFVSKTCSLSCFFSRRFLLSFNYLL